MFSQIFLQDTDTIHSIINFFNPKSGENILEIGPGNGELTKHLLKKCSNIFAIEIDYNLSKKLTNKFKKNIYLYQEDATKFNFSKLHKKKIRIIGNLPYHITSSLLLHIIKYIPYIQDMYFMLQKEIVERIIAKPNNKKFGRLSIIMQYHFKIKKLLYINAKKFFPIPKVDSIFFSLKPYYISPFGKVNTEILSKVTKIAFQKRRKLLTNSLNKNIIKKLKISTFKRPESIHIKDWVKISSLYQDLNLL